jgi:hypothetical protein
MSSTTTCPQIAAGWTSAWLDDEGASQLQGLGDFVSLSEQDVGLAVRVAAQGITLESTLTAEHAASRAAEVAVALSQLFGAPNREADVLRVLDGAHGSEEVLAEELAGILELPQLWEERPHRSAVAHRGDPQAAQMAGRIAGPSYLTRIDPDWTVLSKADHPADYFPLATAAAVAGAKRRSVVLALWRGSGDAAGFSLFHGRDIVAGAIWNTGWRYIESGTEQADEAARILVDQIADGEANIVALRSLLRVAVRHSDPLVELTSLLNIPSEILAVLDAPAPLASTQRLARLSPVRTWWEIAKAAAAKEPSTPRWLRALWAGATVLVAIVCLGMTALGIAVVATDGAVVDDQSATARDWVFIPVFALLTLLLTVIAIRRIGRARL